MERSRTRPEERAKRLPLQTTAGARAKLLPEVLSHLGERSRGIRDDTGRGPPDRDVPPRDSPVCPFDDAILEAIARMAEKCAEFLEAVEEARYWPTDAIPIPPMRQSFIVRLGSVESTQRLGEREAAKRYARLWCGRVGQSGLNVRIVRVDRTVEAHYRGLEHGEAIAVREPDPMDWLREAAEELLGRSFSRFAPL